MGIIKKLPDDVVNFIAAGEVIAKPSNAVKELIENSMDAGATEISITISDGGLSLLQVQDNGCGIDKDDLSIVAERFTTSKLKSTEDLKKMQTYGFRGEALASISCMSLLSITSRTKNSNVAFSANFLSGKLDETIKVSAGQFGTIVTVKNLFNNLSVRKKSFKNSIEDRNRISDIIARYAIENPGISFSFRNNSNKISFRTTGKNDIKECVTSLLGADVGNYLLERNFVDKRLQFECKLVFTKPKAAHTSTYIKDKAENKRIFHIFINKRLVDCTSLQSAVNYEFSFCDKICNFMSISLKINPERVDVNVHPSKKDVIFLNSEKITRIICDYIKDYCLNEANAEIELKDNTHNLSLDFDVLGYNKSKKQKTNMSQEFVKVQQDDKFKKNSTEVRDFDKTSQNMGEIANTFLVEDKNEDKKQISVGFLTSKTDQKTYLNEPNPKRLRLMEDDNKEDQPLIMNFITRSDESNKPQLSVRPLEMSSTKQKQLNQLSTKKIYDYYKDRTNTVDRKIHEFFPRDDKDDFRRDVISQDIKLVSIGNYTEVTELKNKEDQLNIPFFRTFKMKSLKVLTDEVFQSTDTQLKEIFHRFTFVGFPKDLDYLLIQHDTSLFRLKFVSIFGEIFYQLFLFSFGNFGVYRFEAENDDDLPYLFDLLKCHLLATNTDLTDKAICSDIDKGVKLLMDHKDMLWDYFGILFETKNSQPYLSAIPLLLKNYIPHYEALPCFIYNLVGSVDYSNELRCIQQLCCILSDFYIPKTKFCAKVEVENNGYCLNKRIEQWQEIVKEILIPLISKFCPSNNLRSSKAVYKVTNCHELYKIFERC